MATWPQSFCVMHKMAVVSTRTHKHVLYKNETQVKLNFIRRREGTYGIISQQNSQMCFKRERDESSVQLLPNTSL